MNKNIFFKFAIIRVSAFGGKSGANINRSAKESAEGLILNSEKSKYALVENQYYFTTEAQRKGVTQR